MKIICKDNFDRETKDDTLVCENVNEYYSKFIADSLNDRFGGPREPDFYCVVTDDYKLYKFEP